MIWVGCRVGFRAFHRACFQSLFLLYWGGVGGLSAQDSKTVVLFSASQSNPQPVPDPPKSSSAYTTVTPNKETLLWDLVSRLWEINPRLESLNPKPLVAQWYPIPYSLVLGSLIK